METTQKLIDQIILTSDVVVRTIPYLQLEIVFITTIVDLQRIEEHILKPLTERARIPHEQQTEPLEEWIANNLHVAKIKTLTSPKEAAQSLLDSAAVICSSKGYLAIDMHGQTRRTPEEPKADTSIRGPRDGFTEIIDVNVSLIRTRVKDEKLQMKERIIGERTKTKVLVVFIEDLANPRIVKEVFDRLDTVKIDGVLDSGTLEQWIEDNHWSPYPQMQATERPDKTVAALLEGRIAIMVDGSPFVLLAPTVMLSFFQTTDDYSQRWVSGTALRLIRIIALLVSIFIPSLYIALTMFNPELIPLKMVLQLAATREGIPLPIVAEATFMEIMVELVREAGNRMPQQMGQSYTIVGGLVIGDMAVQAGIVSPIMVVAVGLTALGAYAIPNYEAAFVTRMIRFPMLLTTSIFGIVGTIAFTLMLFAHLCTLRSFGVPYLTPFVQMAGPDLHDSLIRAPLQFSEKRPGTYWSPRKWLRRANQQKGT
ncbi:spore germination protein [Sulfoacidibacillus thermotolerans]|uniref:Spore germination protein n=1 Tax=Sulfoacidibacillus thermotolerans TaxID=1765684 RepID=A0A2U3DCA6_SULT2|nr:spore germination protein [Sulfoacidibacillus thermotolerans]PWI58906.1 hypothetical protein BM613_02150 [Sulfoacidibacillus thermotolerans]